ncbi:hypothetical protein BYT27DRAFT_7117956 [Phlegmacium glaucopus]|nr:hypothetical protein BYT27DRAFT_7117956 [Phlegmacium glaucopus]
MQVDVPSQPTATENSTPPQCETTTESLETRRLAYVHLTNGVQPRSQSSINKSISLFLAQNQARNDASNRAEFLFSLAERKKRQRVEETEGGDSSHPTDSGEAMSSDIVDQKAGTCARVDAKPIDRDAQMKYDIAKDDCGPLSRSAKAGLPGEKEKMKSSLLEVEATETKPKATTTTKEVDEEVTSARHPGLDDRLKNIEDHVAVRFVPNPPRTLLARLKFLEDHLIKLEKEYPPWAALHFNQPGRGWPPPPRTTPIIVPVHLRDTTSASSTSIESTPDTASGPKKNKKGKSSLHRAVMERLEVKKAMSEIT